MVHSGRPEDGLPAAAEAMAADMIVLLPPAHRGQPLDTDMTTSALLRRSTLPILLMPARLDYD
jgi:hypothetical protein